MKRVACPFSVRGLSPLLWASVAAWLLVLPAATSPASEGAQPRVPTEKNQHEGPDIAPSTVANVKDAIGRVYRLIVDMDGAVKGGTAFLVSGQRIVATNHHVVEKGTAFTLGFVGENHRVRRMPLRRACDLPAEGSGAARDAG